MSGNLKRQSATTKKQTSIRSFFSNASNDDVKNEQLDDEHQIDSDLNDDSAPPKSKSTKKKYARKQGECIKCKRQMRIHAKNMCRTCYRNSLEPNCCCLKCMAVARVGKEGLCQKCYNKEYVKESRTNVDKHRECKVCKQTKLIQAHGLCQKCYKRSKPKLKGKCQECSQLKILKTKNTCDVCYRKKLSKTDIRMCKNCGEMLPHAADQMCRECYDKTRRENSKQHKECVKCGETAFIAGHGLCQLCYTQTRKEDTSQHKKCIKCNKIKFIKGRGLCTTCNRKDNAQKIKSDTSKHKKCSRCKKIKPIRARECCNACYMKIFANPKAAAKRKQAKKPTLTPKIEVSSGDEDEDFGQYSTNVKTENLSDNDEQQPGPSWKY